VFLADPRKFSNYLVSAFYRPIITRKGDLKKVFIKRAEVRAALDAMTDEVVALIQSEGRNDIPPMTKVPALGALHIKCDESLAEKIAALPSVANIKPEAVYYVLTQDRKRKTTKYPKYGRG